MAVSQEGLVQRSHAYAIVDEVDSILIDEARTPLIISGEPESAATTYYDFARIVKELDAAPATRKGQKGEDETELSGADYLYDEKHKTVSPAQTAIEKVERALKIENLYDPRHVQLVNHLIQALKAQSLYQRDVDYVVQDGEVKIVDEFTGRIMEGRRWSDGLHQAVEAKEGVRIQEENQTLATITLQNYFRLYEKLAGMTGTAKTEEKEFVEIYNLHVVEIPTNVPVAARRRERLHLQDEGREVRGRRRRHQGAARGGPAGARRHDRGRDVRVPLGAPEAARHPAQRAEREGARARVRDHQGRGPAGRGHDRDEHGRPRRRHQARRGRRRRWAASTCSRPSGTSRAGSTTSSAAARAARATRARRASTSRRRTTSSASSPATGSTGSWSASSCPTTSRWRPEILSRQIENAQKKVEEQNFVARKNVLKYDDVMNTQRQVIYEQRRRVLDGEDLSEDVREWIREVVEANVANATESEFPEEWDLDALVQQMQALYGTDITVEELREEVELEREALIEEFVDDALETYEEKEQQYGAELMREIERYVILQVVDSRWRSHLDSMDYLRDGIHLRAMAQKDPLVEYRAEGHAMFEELGGTIREEVVLTLFHAQIEVNQPQQLEPEQGNGNLPYQHETAAGAEVIAASAGGAGAAATAVATPVQQGQVVNEHKDVGRNDPCWCGSGKKFKKCHGA